MSRPLPENDAIAWSEDPDFIEKIELVELLMYPLPWREPEHFEAIDGALCQVWVNICATLRVDTELRFIYIDYEDSYYNKHPWLDSMPDVTRARDNAERWIESAKLQMTTLCAPLYSRIVGRKDYPKHYPRYGESEEQMKDRSRHNDAILAHRYTEEKQQSIFVQLLEHVFPIVLTEKDSVFIVELGTHSGYSCGIACTKLVCKVNATTCLVHYYPVHENEISKYRKKYSNPILKDPLFDMGIDMDIDMGMDMEIDESELSGNLIGEYISNLIDLTESRRS